MSAPLATVASMIGLIVVCCTLASMCRTTWPPRWIRPRMGGLSFSGVPRPGAPASLRRRPSRPFWPRPRAGPCARPRRRPHRPPPYPPAVLLVLCHGLHVRGVQAEFLRNLPVREVQAHEIEAQYPHPQRLMVPGQRRAGEVVEAPGAGLTPIALSMRLRVVAPIADDRVTATPGTAHAFRPAMLAHQREAFGVVQQLREVDQVG